MLQYFSAFDDEVEENATGEQSEFPEGILDSVPEEPPEAVANAASEPQPDEESPANPAEPARPSASVVHGPYYYFYQGRKFHLSHAEMPLSQQSMIILKSVNWLSKPQKVSCKVKFDFFKNNFKVLILSVYIWVDVNCCLHLHLNVLGNYYLELLDLVIYVFTAGNYCAYFVKKRSSYRHE